MEQELTHVVDALPGERVEQEARELESFNRHVLDYFA
jgi:hypothetical protein